MKTVRRIALISVLILFANIGNSQSITFKKLFAIFDDNWDENINCKNFNNDNSFLLTGGVAQHVTILKIDSFGNLYAQKIFTNAFSKINIMFLNDTVFALLTVNSFF